MKSIKVLFIAMLLIPVLVQAQVQETPADVATQQTTWMQENLDLTPEQLEEVKEINLKYAEKRQKVFASTDAADGKMNNLTIHREEYTEELSEIFNPDQFAKFEAAEKEWFEKDKSKIGNPQE